MPKRGATATHDRIIQHLWQMAEAVLPNKACWA